MVQVTEMVFSSPVDMRYLSAKIAGEVNAYVSIFIAKKTDPERLNAYGVGMLSPKATDDTKKGRQMNRRVELVKQ